PTYVIYFSPRRFTSPRTCETMRGRAGLRARGPPNSSKPPPGAHAENSLTRFDPAGGVAALIQMGRLNDFAGYAYAHWLTRYAPGRLSVAAHLTVMIAAVFALPLSIACRLGPAAGERASPVADRVVHGLDRLAVLRARGQQPAASGLVRAH